MEEYLQYMKTLRSQMNDMEDEAAKISVEEEMQLTNIRTLEKDIDLAKSGITQFKEDSEKMKAVKGEICSKILEKQKRIASLEFDISKLSQPELKAADVTALEEEYNALLSDKAGETEYLRSLEKQVEKLKEISHVVKCACGEEYTVAVNR
uniref:Uncharacterized protein n=1 Tax=Cajanus cajan TaxID=3821 RepID=A0A151RA41_CAJCA|nr:hypothetical protein KK1_039286 [Cajanus cajan]